MSELMEITNRFADREDAYLYQENRDANVGTYVIEVVLHLSPG
jgi:hypothetical protein